MLLKNHFHFDAPFSDTVNVDTVPMIEQVEDIVGSGKMVNSRIDVFRTPFLETIKRTGPGITVRVHCGVMSMILLFAHHCTFVPSNVSSVKVVELPMINVVGENFGNSNGGMKGVPTVYTFPSFDVSTRYVPA